MHTTTRPLQRHLATTASVLLLCLGSSAHAQTDAPAPDSAWRFQATPYVWLIGLKGDLQLSPHLPKVHVSQSFSDVLSDLKAAAFVSGTARRDRYVWQADASYASVSSHAQLPLGLQARAKVQQSSLTLTGGYQWQPTPQDSIDTMVGVRGWHLRSSLQVAPLLSERMSKSFVDPIVALRWRHQWSDRWSTLLYADAGGFGVGSESTWQVLATVNYQLRDTVYLSAGYRQLNVDYRSGHQRLDVRLGGPVLGATFRF